MGAKKKKGKKKPQQIGFAFGGGTRTYKKLTIYTLFGVQALNLSSD